MTHFLSNRFLRVTFDANRGIPLSLHESADGANLLSAFEDMYQDEGTMPVFETQMCACERASVESVARSDKLEITRRFELGRNDSLLKIRYRVRPIGRGISVKALALPRIRFAADFTDAFEDERDCYDDGAELGDGREFPCWRVFFRKDKDAGLIVATRSKEQMSHLLIGAQGFDILPHVRPNYSTNYELPATPMVFKGKHRAGYEAAFEIGPWRRDRHVSIARSARLEEPSLTENPPPGGRPGRKPKGKVFYAHRFATPRSASSEFRADRWMIVKVPWAQQGKVLYAGTGVRARPVTLRPNLPRGDYRMFVGIGNAQGVKLQVQGDPEVTFRLVPIAQRKAHRRDTFDLTLSGRQRTYEVEVGRLRLAPGQKISIHRWPDLHVISMIDYIRFEPAAAPRTAAAGPRMVLAGMADAPDMAPLVDPFDPSPEAPRSIIWEHARCGFSKVYWRIDGQCSDFPSRHNTMRYVSAKVHGMFYAPAKVYGRMLRRFDMLQAVVEAGRKYGVEIWGWMRFNSYAGNVQSEFFRNHPEYHEHWENGPKAAKLCLAFPEVRKHKIDILVEAAGYGLGGVNLGFLRHAPVVMRHPILVEGFTRAYGNPPPAVFEPKDLTYRFSLPPEDEQSVLWYRYRAQFLTQFGRELRAAFKAAGLAHVKVSLWVRPNHHLYDGIDLDAWLNEGLCDEVVASARVAPDERLSVAEPTARWRRAV